MLPPPARSLRALARAVPSSVYTSFWYSRCSSPRNASRRGRT